MAWWLCGPVALWPCGLVALWPVALWPVALLTVDGDGAPDLVAEKQFGGEDAKDAKVHAVLQHCDPVAARPSTAPGGACRSSCGCSHCRRVGPPGHAWSLSHSGISLSRHGWMRSCVVNNIHLFYRPCSVALIV